MYEIDEKCRECKNNGTAICNRCDMFYDEFEPIDRAPQTNADRIRAMSVEEMAEIMKSDCPPNYQHSDCLELDCQQCWLNWLKQEVEEAE